MSHLLVTHIACMMLGFALLMVHGIASYLAACTASADLIVSRLRKTAWMGLAGRAAVMAGLALGLVLARPFGFTAPWLLGAYLAMLLSIAIGAAVLEPFQKKLLAAAQARSDLTLFAQSRLPLNACLFNSVLWIVIIWLMTAKPA